MVIQRHQQQIIQVNIHLLIDDLNNIITFLSGSITLQINEDTDTTIPLNLNNVSKTTTTAIPITPSITHNSSIKPPLQLNDSNVIHQIHANTTNIPQKTTNLHKQLKQIHTEQVNDDGFIPQ